jgi:hypothetical protein
VVRLMTLTEVAKSALITRRHLERMCGRGEGPTVVCLGKRRVVTEQDFDDWIESRRQKPRAKTAKAVKARAVPAIPSPEPSLSV